MDDDLTWSPGLDGLRALHELAPNGAEALDRLSGAVSARREWVDTVRLSCARALELTPLTSGATSRPHANVLYDSTLAVLDEFAAQFSIDVSTLDDGHRSQLCEATGETLSSARGHIIAMTWIADFVPRVRACLDRLFAPSDWPAVPELELADATELAYEFIRIVYNLHAVDPALSEMVRLHGARAHNCRLCKSVRSRAALEAGVTEADFASIDDFEHSTLSAAQKTALALVDSIIWTPARIDNSVVAAVRAQFTPTQIVEIVLDVMRNAWNKTTVAAALDEAHVSEGTEIYEYMDDGTVQYGLSHS